MTDKTEGQKMQYEPRTIPPGGLTMNNWLELTPTPHLIFILVTVPFRPITDRNLYGYIV